MLTGSFKFYIPITSFI